MMYQVQEFNRQQAKNAELINKMAATIDQIAADPNHNPKDLQSKKAVFQQLYDFHLAACAAVGELWKNVAELERLRSELDRNELHVRKLLEQAHGYGLDTSLLAYAHEKDLIKYKRNR